MEGTSWVPGQQQQQQQGGLLGLWALGAAWRKSWGYEAASEVIPCLVWREWSCQLDQSFAITLCL